MTPRKPTNNTAHGPVRVVARLGVLAIAIAIALGFPPSAFSAQPPNDDFADAQNLGTGPTASASGTNRWATAEAGEPDHYPGFPATRSVWYRWTASASGVVRVDTCGSDFDTVVAVYRGSAVDALGRVASDDDSCDLQSRVRFFATAGTTYRIAVDGYDVGSIKLELRPAVAPPNDDFANAFDLGSGLTASASGTNLDATVEPGEPNHYHGLPATASVWYRWTSAANRKVQVETCGSDFDTVLAVYAGSALDALRRVARDDDSCDVASRVHFDATAGTSYQIAVDGYGGSEGSIALTLAPSNQFRFGKAERDKQRGTARLAVNVPNAGELKLARTKRVRGAAVTAEAAGEVRLAVIPRAKARRGLRRRGSVRVKAKITYTPDGGQPSTRAKWVKLVRRR